MKRLPGQVTWHLYVCCMCVRHGPHASQARWLHGSQTPGVDRGVWRLVLAVSVRAYEVLFFTCAQFRSYVLVCCELTDG